MAAPKPAKVVPIDRMDLPQYARSGARVLRRDDLARHDADALLARALDCGRCGSPRFASLSQCLDGAHTQCHVPRRTCERNTAECAVAWALAYCSAVVNNSQSPPRRARDFDQRTAADLFIAAVGLECRNRRSGRVRNPLKPSLLELAWNIHRVTSLHCALLVAFQQSARSRHASCIMQHATCIMRHATE